MSFSGDEGERTDVFAIPLAVEDREETNPVATGLQLLCVAGDDLGKTFALEARSMIIGRGKADLALRATDVSRKHARIWSSSGSHWIEDLGSVNGTLVNGAPLREPFALRFGDRVQIGSTILVFSRHDELEERLRQLQKLDAMGALVKGLAHDFNNTLQVILVGIDTLEELHGGDRSDAHAVLADMTRAAESASGLIQRLLRIGRTQPEALEPVRLDAVLTDALAMARRMLPANVTMQIAGSTEVQVRGSRGELQQVLLNVFVNARDAMPDGGTIDIHVRTLELDRTVAKQHHLQVEGTYVELAVRDSGIGMEPSVIERAFEPFFTTKGEGKGSGLGLAMIYSTIKSHGGAVLLESEPRRGTTVRIFLPVAR
ncbi:MAG: FHA domain-containing protein [Deltaproteobacteria bacterium]|nr:FHA domain-containing protein [Deltaproteobacteria bacterium]